MHIGLYDIDLHHSPNPVFNLELMKIFNYFYSKGIKVSMMRPQDDEGRFSKIIYFKDSPNFQVPKHLVLTGDNKKIFGYGFYGKVEPLKEPYCAAAPSFLPYDPYSSKFGTNDYYQTVKKNSIVRMETNDLTGLKESKIIYVVDRKPLNKDIPSFISQFQNKKFNFFHSLIFETLEQYYNLKSFSHLFLNRFTIAFPFDSKFFLSHMDKDFLYLSKPFPKEKELNFQIRFVEMILAYKYKKLPIGFRYEPANELLKRVFQWGKSNSYQSYKDYYKTCKAAQNELLLLPNGLRLLLKQNPETYNPEYLDF